VWNKNRDDAVASRPQPAPAPAVPAVPPYAAPRPQPAPPPVQTAAPLSQAAMIGASMTVKGEISAREELLVDGEVEGSLESHSLLTVGPHGKVNANIRAREVVIFGTVRGNVEVAGKIAIREKGSLVGDIKAAGISIDDGAYFKGSIDIVRPEPKSAGRPVKSEGDVPAA
jgi:cytoskeletal protein CcmA (bactofilin family)